MRLPSGDSSSGYYLLASSAVGHGPLDSDPWPLFLRPPGHSPVILPSDF